ncbi:MAG: HD domain-containing protein [Spirochaetaceae bacterium]
MKQSKYQFAILFIAIFATLGIFPISVYLFSKYSDYLHKRETYIAVQRELQEQLVRSINYNHLEIIKDLEFIIYSSNFQMYINSDIITNQLTDDLLLLSSLNGNYDQVRYIDINGDEKIRINYNNGEPVIVPKGELQNKKDRYYFKDTLSFKEPTILISKLDLNIENGEIETPYKPMLRYSIPVFDNKGIVKGVLVLNYYADELINSLIEETKLHDSNFMMLNSEGYFFHGLSNDKLWGFMFKDGKENNIINIESLPDDFENEISYIDNNIYIQRKIKLNKEICIKNSYGIKYYQVHQMDDFWVIISEGKNKVYFSNDIIFKIFSSLWHVEVLYLILSLITSYLLTYLVNRNISIKDQKETLKQIMNKVVNALEATSLLDDDDTGCHIKRVCEYSYILAKKYGLSESVSKEIKELASLHDIGKVGVHDNILKKQGKLNKDEWEEMKRHVLYGMKLVSNLNLSPAALNIVLYHHENWDGSGYTNNLIGESIPLEARIVALADVYDALRNTRSYKPAFSHSKSVEIIKSESGTKFDPEIVNLFLLIADKFNEISIRLK